MNDYTERDAAVARVLKRIRGRKAKTVGAQFEGAVRLRLIGMGFDQVEQIATPMFSRMINGQRRHFHAKKVSGDIKAIDPRTGRQVHVECKNYPDGLPFSALKKHQVTNLDRCVSNRGIAILAWGSTELHLLDWERLRAAGFKPRTTLSPAMVAAAIYRYR